MHSPAAGDGKLRLRHAPVAQLHRGISSLTREIRLLIWNRPGGTGYSQALLRAGSCFPCSAITLAKSGAGSAFAPAGVYRWLCEVRPAAETRRVM